MMQIYITYFTNIKDNLSTKIFFLKIFFTLIY